MTYKDRKYSITPYDPDWVRKFEEETKVIRSIFMDKALRIEHIGSTSVPGLAGKPTIDILALVDDVPEIDELGKKMEAVGYGALGEYVMPGARLFAKEDKGARSVNLHVFPKDHPHVKEMLKLRDYLRAHPEEAKKYGDLKFELVGRYPNDYAQYRKHKDEYMEGLKKRLGEN